MGNRMSHLLNHVAGVFCFADAPDEYDSLSTEFILSYDTYNLYRLNNSKMELFWLFGKDACCSQTSQACRLNAWRKHNTMLCKNVSADTYIVNLVNYSDCNCSGFVLLFHGWDRRAKNNPPTGNLTFQNFPLKAAVTKMIQQLDKWRERRLNFHEIVSHIGSL